MRNFWIILISCACIFSCKKEKLEVSEKNSVVKNSKEITKSELTLEQANLLVDLPLKCVEQEFPNKLGQVLTKSDDKGDPKELHPAFFGCFDWHSAVHGHWVLVKLSKDFPNLTRKDDAINALKNHLSKENIAKEIEYFNRKQEYSYERTYGWAWLLQLALELKTWDNEIGKELSENLQPLTDLIAERYVQFLPKLNYPLRVGTHTNTAFGLSFAYDYAVEVNNNALKIVIEDTAKRLFLEDKDCPLGWEPSGTDFLSPCLEEAEIMSKVLPKDEFLTWLDSFLPKLKNADFKWEVGLVSDRTDGHLVHLDGVNFSRAWCLKRIANEFPDQYGHLHKIANEHIEYSLPSLVGDSYEGGHWLASFAIYALSR